jgi:DNA polymerase-4
MGTGDWQLAVVGTPGTGNWKLPTGNWELGTGNFFMFACLRGGDEADQALNAIARDFSPRVMRVAPGEVLVDVSGLGRLIGEPDAIARELRRSVTDAGVVAVVAMAGTQTTARVLARAPGATALEPLPVALLRDLETLPPGTNLRDRDRLYETLDRWGIATLADLAALPAAGLSSRLGRRVRAWPTTGRAGARTRTTAVRAPRSATRARAAR